MGLWPFKRFAYGSSGELDIRVMNHYNKMKRLFGEKPGSGCLTKEIGTEGVFRGQPAIVQV